MPYFNAPNFAQVILRETHASPTTIVLRALPSPYHSHHLFPKESQVQTGVVFGPGQYEKQEYLTGTLALGGGGGFVGAPIHPFTVSRILT